MDGTQEVVLLQLERDEVQVQVSLGVRKGNADWLLRAL